MERQTPHARVPRERNAVRLPAAKAIRAGICARERGVTPGDSAETSPGPADGRTPVLELPGPFLETARLRLRPFALSDAPNVARLAGRREIADTTTTSIPHPYSEQLARRWVQHLSQGPQKSREVSLAVLTRQGGELVGAAGLQNIDWEHDQAEMVFWIAVEWWRQGLATEAAKALLEFGFEVLRLNRIYAQYMLRNPAAGRVLKRLGMNLEGILHERVRKWDVFEDVALLAILRRDWFSQHKPISASLAEAL